MTKLIFDDEHTGPRYRYGLQNNPVSGANIPEGWIIWSGRPSDEFRHGTLDYPAKLPGGTAINFELVFIGVFAK